MQMMFSVDGMIEVAMFALKEMNDATEGVVSLDQRHRRHEQSEDSRK